MQIIYSKRALKYLKKLHRPKREQIKAAIELLPLGDVIKLQASQMYRLRVNDYRVTFYKESDTIKIDDIDSRGGIY